MNVWETEEWLKIDNLKDEIWKNLYFVENGNVWDYRKIYSVNIKGKIYEYDFTSGVYDGFHWMWK